MEPRPAPPALKPPLFGRRRAGPPRDRYGLHLGLFLLTFASMIFAGGIWAARDVLYVQDAWFWGIIGPSFLLDGLRYAVPFILFLTVHEFGHYIAARRHGISVSLPYYIPLPLPPPFLTFGTLGAVIRIREQIPTTRKLFDVGAAGPLAGFVVALAFLLYALATLPPPTYLMDMSGHELVQEHIRAEGTFPPAVSGDPFSFGRTTLYWALTQLFPNVPPAYEMYHYPVLLAAWLGLFFTALNLLPIGQLDGGHVVYALFGDRWHRRIARATVLLLLLSGSVGVVQGLTTLFAEIHPLLEPAGWVALGGILFYLLGRVFPEDRRAAVLGLLTIFGLTVLAIRLGPAVSQYGYGPWMLWAYLLIRFVRVEHPPVLVTQKLDPVRTALGVLCIALFFLGFSPRPIYGGL